MSAAALIVRGSAAQRAVVGAALLARPAPLARLVSEPGLTPPAWLTRVLGARMLAQGLVELASPRRIVVILGMATDVAHAASMVAVAALTPAYRRAAIASAAEAASAGLLAGVATLAGLE